MENLFLPDAARGAGRRPVVAQLLIAPALVIMLFLACGGGDSANSTPEITVDELHRKAESGADFFLLDVRTYPEFVDARLAFADTLIPYDELAANLEALPDDKSAPIYCFCRSGRRSGISTDMLREMGYNNVFNVSGGILAWKRAGYKTVSGE